MTAEKRNCPQCNTVMSYRLGEYECPSCGHSEIAAPQKQEADYGRPSDSVNRARLITPPGAPPPPSGGYNLGGQPPADMYSPETRRASGGTLLMEKNIYMGIQAVATILILVLLLIASAAMGDMGGGGAVAAMGFSGFIGAAIGLGLLYWVLYGDTVWLKWACLGCQSIGLVIAFVGLFANNAAISATPGLRGFQLAYNLLQFGFALWFASIVYRDIQQHEGY
jgi:hypothetical protein